MQSTGGQAAGFITVTSWSVQGEKVSSTNSSPSHTAQIIEDGSSLPDPGQSQCQFLPQPEKRRFLFLLKHFFLSTIVLFLEFRTLDIHFYIYSILSSQYRTIDLLPDWVGKSLCWS